MSSPTPTSTGSYFASGYFAPNYFAPDYFPGGSPTPTPTPTPTSTGSYFPPPYFAPGYFAPSYFPGGSPTPTPTVTPASVLPASLLGSYGPFGFGPTAFGAPFGPRAVYPDLIAAVVAQLRAFNAGAVAVALGETALTPKIWYGDVFGSPPLPWLVVETPTPRREYMAGGSYIARGELDISVFAAGRAQAQRIGQLVADPVSRAGALDDPPLLWQGERLMKFRLTNSTYLGVTTPAVSSPAAYHWLLTFGFWYSGPTNP